MLRYALFLTTSTVIGLAGYTYVLPHVLEDGWAIYMKATGKAERCSWNRVLTYYAALNRFDELYTNYQKSLKVEAYEADKNLEKFTWPGGRYFWAQRLSGRVHGFGWLLAEHHWAQESSPETHVRKGDIVLDAGAHIGVFTWRALEAGAAKVIAIEPDPTNLECLRRNFPKEIAEGRLVLAPVAVWSSPGTMKMNLGDGGNTGVNSLITRHENKRTIEVRVTTVDLLVKELGLERVNFLKMDIEGAEREALKGAKETMVKHQPRVMLDLNHRPDDAKLLPEIILAANSKYKPVCGPCQMNEHGVAELMPHVIYFE